MFLLVDPAIEAALFGPFAEELRRKIGLPAKGL
jgi:hypothetical protein